MLSVIRISRPGFISPISRETLFHYYVWGFLKLFGFNILSYEAALFVIWLTTFVFTLLLVDLFFRVLHCHFCHRAGS